MEEREGECKRLEERKGERWGERDTCMSFSSMIEQ